MGYGVYVGKPKAPTGYRYVEEIREYRPASETVKQFSLLKEPYMVVKINDSVEYYEKDDIVTFQPTDSIRGIGKHIYKVEERYIGGI